MSDALVGVTEINSASLADISSAMQSYLQQASLLIPTVSDYSAFAVKGAKSVDIPRMGGSTVGDKSENTAESAQTITVAADTITFEKHKVVQYLIEEIAENQARVAYTSEVLMRAAKDIARQVDQDIIVELKLASSSAPDHQLVFVDTSTDKIARADVLAARALLQAQYIDPRECYMGIGPEKEAELLNIDDFIHAEKYGSNMPIMNGEVGRIYGFKVIVHNDFSDFACFWHPTSVGLAFQRGMTVQSQPDLANLATRWSVDTRYGVEVLDSGKRCVLIDSTN